MVRFVFGPRSWIRLIEAIGYDASLKSPLCSCVSITLPAACDHARGDGLTDLVAVAVTRAACAACIGFEIARDTAATAFDVLFWLQVTNFVAPLLQSTPNRLDYIDVLILLLHRHLFVAMFAFGWADWPSRRTFETINRS